MFDDLQQASIPNGYYAAGIVRKELSRNQNFLYDGIYITSSGTIHITGYNTGSATDKVYGTVHILLIKPDG